MSIPSQRKSRRKTPPDRYRRYSDSDISGIRDMAEAGLTRRKIAQATGRTLGSINGMCFYYNISTFGPRRRHSPEFTEAVRILAANRISPSEIADKLDVSRAALASFCHNHSISISEHRRVSPDYVAMVKSYADSGLSRDGIAHTMAASLAKINNICRNYGITTHARRGRRPSLLPIKA